MRTLFPALLVGLLLLPNVTLAATSDAKLIKELRAEIVMLKQRLAKYEGTTIGTASLSEIRTLEKALKERRTDVEKHSKTVKKKCASAITTQGKNVARSNKEVRACSNATEDLEDAKSGVETLSKRLELLRLAQ